MLFRIARAVRHLPVRPITAVLLLLGFAWATGHATRFAHLSTLSLTAAGGLAAAIAITWWIRYLAPAISTGAWVGRRDDASQHAGGVATWIDVGEYAGATAMRRRAPQLRPSLARKGGSAAAPDPAHRVRRAAGEDVWLPIGNVVYSACENVTLRFGGPRIGKTSSLACHAVDAPGALLVTTSRTDLLITPAARAQATRPGRGVQPDRPGQPQSTVRWSAVAGCHDYATALRRAADLIPEGGTAAEGERWDAQARGLLAVLLHAAALRGRPPARRPGLDLPGRPGRRAPDRARPRSVPEPARPEPDVRSIYGTNERTLTSITTTMLPALRWLNDATAADAGDAAPDDPDLLDVDVRHRARDSLYLIGRDGGARTLIGALTAEVAHQVRMHAAAAPAAASTHR